MNLFSRNGKLAKTLLCAVFASVGVRTPAVLAGIASRSLSAGEVPAESNAFTIATFNVRCPADAGEHRWYRRLPRCAEIVRRHRFDVFGVQEATPGEKDILDGELPEFESVGCGRDADRRGEGMYIYYRRARFACLTNETFWLSLEPDVPGSRYPGAACRRTCTWALLEDRVTGESFRYFNTHLDHVSAEARINGLRVIFERGVKPAKMRGETVFLTGDLNETLDGVDTPESLAAMGGPVLAASAKGNPIAFASTELVDTIRVTETPHAGPFRTFHGYGGEPRCRIDYIFATEDVRVLSHATIDDRPGGQFASDHYPVAATVEIRSPEMPPSGLADAAARWNGRRGFWRPNADEAKAGSYALEDPCVFADGTKLASAADWPKRRAEILGIFAREMYGAEPPAPEALVCDLLGEKVTAAGFAVRRLCRMWFRADRTGPSVNWALWLPRHAKGPVPVILFLNYHGNHELVTDGDIPVAGGWQRNRPLLGITDHRTVETLRGRLADPNTDTYFPLPMLLARGYAVMSACYGEVSPDPDGFGADGVDQYPFATTNGVFTLWGPRDESRTDNPTAIGAWAWALSRGLDLALRQREIDPRRTVVTGCSRLGKSALLAAARDERFAVCVPNQCGGGGVCLAKRDFGENVSTEVRMFTHWYCGAYAKYAPDPARLLVFDQHLLVASVAPRRVLVEGFAPSDWMDTKAEYLACRGASRAWEFLGLPGLPAGDWPGPYETSAVGTHLGYVRRTERHGISAFDWTWLLDFADRAFSDRAGE